MSGVSRVAGLSCLVYLTVTAVVRDGVPFVRFPAFAFPDTHGVMALPLFLADGAPADPRDYTAFDEVGPSAVDVAHEGLPSVVAHQFVELERWLADHPGAGGDVQVAIGLRVLRVDDAGRVYTVDRIDGRGTAQRR